MRKLVEECLPYRVDPVGWNPVAGEWLAGRGIGYDEERTRGADALGKIAPALEVGRHGDVSGVLGSKFAL
jgi:hypothetical protein